jgi:hypothetical protein
LKHVTLGLLEANETIGQTLAKNLIDFLDVHGLKKRNGLHVKDEGSNLHIMTIALKFVVNYELLGLEESIRDLVFNLPFLKHVNME